MVSLLYLFHHFHKSEHLARPFVSVVLFAVGLFMVRFKILAPKL